MLFSRTELRARRFAPLLAFALAGCGEDSAAPGKTTKADGGQNPGGDGGTGGTGGTAATPNPDGDCLSDEQEAELGTDPNKIDSDDDGIGDCEEVACVSDPIDPAEKCYACGWKHNDPGNLVSTGAS